MNYTVFIPTAGIGSRLGDETRNINKSLVAANNKPIISHQISLFPSDTNFVIALGHKGNLVKEFLNLTYPKYKFSFVNVNPYEGKGSGLGFTLVSCKKYLMRPFIFMSCDTLVTKKIPPPDHDWMFYSNVKNISEYRSLEVKKGIITNIFEKGRSDKKLKAYTGLAGIYSYDQFWSEMLNGGKKVIEQGESYALRKMIDNQIKAIHSPWFDSGNQDSLQILRKKFRSMDSPNILPKENEAIWFVENNAIKFSIDKNFIKERVQRAKKIQNFVPKIISHTPNMYKYNKVDGEVLSKVISVPLFLKLLKRSDDFWKIKKLNNAKKNAFKKECLFFYKNKTIDRINQFYLKFKTKDKTEIINGKKVPTLELLINKIDWNDISNGIPSRFHGDYHFENILWNNKNNLFTFLDWRQNFSGNLNYGDLYYDLAKLMHGLIVSHDAVNKNQFTIDWGKKEIKYSIYRKKVLKDCELYFAKWIALNNYSLKKVNIICALIFLNIAALHHYPYSLFLHALGKDMLHSELS